MLMADLGAEGNEASKARLILLARGMAERKGIDPALVCGLCEVESAWQPWAVRYEERYKWLVGLGVSDPPANAQDMSEPIDMDVLEGFMPKGSAPITEWHGQRTSWGLMQIMGAVARERGLKGWLTRMLQPEVNLSIGIKHLQWLAGRGWSGKDMISAYNQGSPRRHSVRKSGAEVREYVNQAYVSKVLKAMRGYQT